MIFRKKIQVAAVIVLAAVALTMVATWKNGAAPAAGVVKSSRDGSKFSTSKSVFAGRDREPGRKKASLAEQLADEGNKPVVSRGQIQAFLNARNRSADSLLAAFRLMGDEAFLNEALERFPENPQVLLTKLSREGNPAAKLKILEVLKRTDPDNGLVNCLAARNLFELGRGEGAIAELRESRGKPLEDFLVSSCQTDEEAYLSAGVTPASAKMTALYSSTAAHVIQLRNLAKDIQQARDSHQPGADGASPEDLREIQMEIGQQLQGGVSLVSKLVGMVLEKGILKGDDSEDSVARLQELDQRREELTSHQLKISEQMKNPDIPETEWALYFDRIKIFGEAAANDWMLERYPAP